MKKVILIAVTTLFSVGVVFAGPLEDRIIALEAKVAALEANQAVQIGQLGYMRLDTNELNGVIGPHVIFEGVNLHLQNGADSSWAVNGLGNFIVGYNEIPEGIHYGDLLPGDRSGSHNYVAGWRNRFTQNAYCGVVVGEGNSIGGEKAIAIGGDGNQAMASQASVVGGFRNTAMGDNSVIAGGVWNQTIGNHSVVSGGEQNRGVGDGSTITGGNYNEALGPLSSVSGGFQRTATGEHDWTAGSLWEDQ